MHIETSADTTGAVVEMLGVRRGRMIDMREMGDGSVRMVYIVPTRGMLGFPLPFPDRYPRIGCDEYSLSWI